MVDIEISGGVALREPEWTLWGTRGALNCTGGEISLKFLDPRRRLASPEADPETPGLKPGRAVKLHWIEKTQAVNTRGDEVLGTIWNELYATIRRGRPFPIRLEEALQVMKILDAASRNRRGVADFTMPGRGQ